MTILQVHITFYFTVKQL